MRALALGLVLLTACGGDDDGRRAEPRQVPIEEVEELAEDAEAEEGMTPEDRPGNAAVYRRIDALTDCDELEDELDTHVGNAELRDPGDVVRTVSIAYAQATVDRLLELGCR